MLDRAADFVIRNGRVLERRLFAFLFRDGDAEAVAEALRGYRNADGGFGWGLEPDKRDPASQPQDIQIAFEVLDAIGLPDHPMALTACDWLASVTTDEGGVPFALPSVNDHPHAPWWTVREAAPPAHLNPTAAIVGLALKGGLAHPWIEQASAFCWRAIEASQATGYHDLAPAITFLEHAPDRPRADRALDAIAQRLTGADPIELDPHATGYRQKPTDWAPTPQSFARRLFTMETMGEHLAALAARQQEDGGWPITWEPISPGVELEWRGIVTVRALSTLKAYDALS